MSTRFESALGGADRPVESLRVLHLEDNPRDAMLIGETLAACGLRAETTHVRNRAEFTAALEDRTYDLILSDYALPDLDGLEALQIAVRIAPDLPFILLSGTLGEEAAIESLRSGATDYVLKQRLSNLEPAVRRALKEAEERRTRRAAESALRQTFERLTASERRFSAIFRGSPAAMGMGPLRSGRLIVANDRLVELMGYSREELIGRTVHELGFLADAEDRLKLLGAIHTDGTVREFECRLRRKSGEVFEASMAVELLDLEGEPQLLVMPSDISERKRAERHRTVRHGITRVLAEATVLTDSAPLLLASIGQPFHWDLGLLWLREGDEPAPRCVAVWEPEPGSFPGFLAEVRRFEAAPRASPMGLLDTAAGPVSIRDLEPLASFPLARAAHAAGLRGACGFPISSSGRQNGAIEFFGRPNFEGHPSVHPMLADLGEQIGQFFGRRQAEHTLLERTRLAALTADVSVALANGDALPEMLRLCTETVVRGLGAEYAGVWTLDASGRRLELQSGSGADLPVRELGGTVELGQAGLGRIAAELRPYFSNDVHHDPRLQGESWIRDDALASFAGHPLLVEGRLVGILAILSSRPLTDSTLKAIAAVADAVAVGVDRKRASESRRKLEAQFLQAQKMEAVGRLAGGIAHDFNNLLTAILGFGHIALSELPPGDPLESKLRQIVRAGERATGLTRQLLAFSRKQVLEPRVLDLNAVVKDVEKMLRRTIGEDLELDTRLEGELGSVFADPGQIEQILMNLAVNARDAMPEGGRITIATANVAGSPGAEGLGPAASEVSLSVWDTGIGMDEQTRSRIFEPFFTTKDPGHGTGLGLSTVYGIVEQSGGRIAVTSEPGRGTRFDIHLPRVESRPRAESCGSEAALPRGAGTVLVVEDDEIVRNLVRAVLESGGYRVLDAGSGLAALELVRRAGNELDLVLTDIVMPEMNGRVLSQRLEELRPGTRILFMSGYTGDPAGSAGATIPNEALLRKPFTPAELARKVREALDAPPRTAP